MTHPLRPRRIEGYAIISEDGMLANAGGVIPDLLKFEADKEFFERGIDGTDVVVHGRNSREEQHSSKLRRRLILTRQIASIAVDPSNEKALFWNAAGASLEQALAVLRVADGIVGVLGGTDVFGLFLDRFDVFHLTRAPDVRLPGGRPIFPEYRGGRPRRCWQATASTPPNVRCSMRHKASRSPVGDVLSKATRVFSS